MIRTFSIFIAAVLAGKLIAIWNDDIGFYSTAILFVLIEMSPRFVMLAKENKFRSAIIKWMKENDLTEYNLKQGPPNKREINLQASDIQLIYVIKSKSTRLDDITFYAVCGSWLLGLFSETIVFTNKTTLLQEQQWFVKLILKRAARITTKIPPNNRDNR